MQAVSILLSPLIMSGADALFSNLQEDKYLKETKRHNDRMEKIEQERIVWDQKFAKNQQELEKKRFEKTEAKEQQSEDRSTLKLLLQEKGNIKLSLKNEKELHIKKNPFYMTSDLLVSGLIVFIGYRLVRR